ncbi:MAG: hypothetical protein M1812_007420 [Candelaria pacifica]|nr:MAG: hypothetical protein M1812_007420 [Candelaria pacifica]
MGSAMLGNLWLGARSSLPKTKIPPLILHTDMISRSDTPGTISGALTAGHRGFDISSPLGKKATNIHISLTSPYKQSKIERGDLFLQTGFGLSSVSKSKDLPIIEQIRRHLTDRPGYGVYQMTGRGLSRAHIDLVMLNWPRNAPNSNTPAYHDLMKELLETWRNLEDEVPSRIHHLGLNRVTSPVLEDIYKAVRIKPSLVSCGFRLWRQDPIIDVQDFCLDKGIVFAGQVMSEWWQAPRTKEFKSDMPYRTKFLENLSLRFDLPDLMMMACLAAGMRNTVFRVRAGQEGLSRVRGLQEWAQQNAEEWQSLVQEFQHLIRMPQVQQGSTPTPGDL